MLNQLIVKLLPLMPKALIKRVAMRYVAGETPVETIHAVKALNREGVSTTIDFLGEFITTPEEAYATARMYQHILHEINSYRLDANISVKLTALGLLLDKELCERLMNTLVGQAAALNIFVRIDMEDSPCTDATIDLYLKLRQTYSNVGIVMQAYLHRTYTDVERIINAGAGYFRLCKGIYVEPADIAYKSYEEINANYLKTLELMLSRQCNIGIATHDPTLIEAAQQLIHKYNPPRETVEFQMLLGVGMPIRSKLLARGYRVRIYVPFGEHWYAYCIRRLKENPKIAGYVLGNIFHS